MEFLEKYPTPWRLETTEWKEEGPGSPGEARIVAANGERVIVSYDSEGYESGLAGDVDGLIAFVNSLG